MNDANIESRENARSALNRNLVWLLIFVGLAIHFSGAFGTIFSGDSALYAAISKSFATSGNWFDIYVGGKDWLDKPHFPFWLCALSMKVFGINAFAYRLPSLALFAVGLVYTYKLAARLYDRDIALLAVLILTYSLHIFISDNDVRAESILIGLIMGGVHHFYRSCTGDGLLHVVIGSLFCAAAVMTKGPFVVIVFGSAIGGYLIGNRDFKQLFSPKWLLAFALIFIFITPELFALYWQFDLHPEKDIFGQTNVSGLKFFVWDTQFGRFFNSGPFKGSGSPLFYFQTVLWAFAPWAVIGYAAFGRRIVEIVRRRQAAEYLTVFGFLIMFAVFSASRFQLPYYVNILYPFLAIICAEFVRSRLDLKATARWVWAAGIFYAIVFTVAIGGAEFVFEGQFVTVPLIFVAVVVVFSYLIFVAEKNTVLRAIFCSATAVGLLAVYMNIVFYPRLLHYQAGSAAAMFANENLPGVTIGYSQYDNLMQFYAKSDLIAIATSDDAKAMSQKGKIVLFVDDAFRKSLDDGNINYKIVKELEDYRITRLTPQFLDPRKRADAVSHKYLITIE